MSIARFREILREGEVVLSAWAGLGDPVVHETLLEAFDVLTLDVQHGLQGIEEIREGCARAVGKGKPALVRVPVGDLAMAGRVLDFGASGVILPMVNSAAEASHFARSLLYPPKGTRSFGPARALSLFGGVAAERYISDANDSVISLAMIETAGPMARSTRFSPFPNSAACSSVRPISRWRSVGASTPTARRRTRPPTRSAARRRLQRRSAPSMRPTRRTLGAIVPWATT